MAAFTETVISDAQERVELQRLAAGLSVLEMGAWKGRTTVWFAEVAESVVSVDHHLGPIQHGVPSPERYEPSLDEYYAAVRGFINIVVVIADFEIALPHLGSFDFVFVDGDHDQQSVCRDVGLAVEHLNDGGTLCLHDWDLREVRLGARDALGMIPPDRVDGRIASYSGSWWR